MAEVDAIATLVMANDKLLKALITLLAIKDDHLLDELSTIFVLAGRTRNEIGGATEATWAHIRKELKLIGALVDDAKRYDSEDAEQLLRRLS